MDRRSAADANKLEKQELPNDHDKMHASQALDVSLWHRESICKNHEKNKNGMDISDSGLASSWHQGVNKLNAVGSAWQNSSHKHIQTDGRKLKKSVKNRAASDMSLVAARLATFENFENKALIEKLSDSGYYYNGENDTTICYKCGATVSDWFEKDNPATFHEPDCDYHQLTGEGSNAEFRVAEEGNISTYEDICTTSILDAPITDTSNILPPPVTLTPTVVPTVKVLEDHSNLPTNLLAREKLPTRRYQHNQTANSLPLPQKINLAGINFEESTQIKSLGNKKELTFAKFGMATVHTLEHQTLLSNLDLCSEEDRRKSFSADDKWKQNTNNVIEPHDLARDGFFYLGNLDRTQCFSCKKVFRNWMREDRVNKVHKENVPYCSMARGADVKNKAAERTQNETPTTSSVSSNASNIHYPQQESSSFERPEVPQPFTPSHQAQILGSSHATEPRYSMPVGMPVQPSNSPSHQSNILQPLDLSLPRRSQHRLPSLVKANMPALNMPSGASSSLGENYVSIPAATPKVRASFLPSEEPMEYLHGVQPQSESPSSGEGHQMELSTTARNVAPYFPIPPASQSFHLGQTTLYDIPSPSIGIRANVRNTPSILAPVVATTSSMVEMGQSVLSNIFPCNEPAKPGLRSAVSRQETFDYRWPSNVVHASIDEIAKAGFYYMGNGDHVRCWYCNGGILHWNPDDDPWEEHARLYPTCEYLLQQKGPEYISEVSARHQGSQGPSRGLGHEFYGYHTPSSSSSSGFPTPGHSSPSGSPVPGSPFFGEQGFPFNVAMFGGHRSSPGPPQVIDPRAEEIGHKQELERAMNSEATMHAVEMGFQMDIIKKVMKRKIRLSGAAFLRTEALMEALLDFAETGSTDSSDPEASPPAGQSAGAGTSAREGSGEGLPAAAGGESGLEPKPSLLSGAEDLDPKELDERLREYQQAKRCKVCLDRDADVVFVPCGHLCTCVQCASALRSCPLCRKRIKKSMKTYTS